MSGSDAALSASLVALPGTGWVGSQALTASGGNASSSGSCGSRRSAGAGAIWSSGATCCAGGAKSCGGATGPGVTARGGSDVDSGGAAGLAKPNGWPGCSSSPAKKVEVTCVMASSLEARTTTLPVLALGGRAQIGSGRGGAVLVLPPRGVRADCSDRYPVMDAGYPTRADCE